MERADQKEGATAAMNAGKHETRSRRRWHHLRLPSVGSKSGWDPIRILIRQLEEAQGRNERGLTLDFVPCELGRDEDTLLEKIAKGDTPDVFHYNHRNFGNYALREWHVGPTPCEGEYPNPDFFIATIDVEVPTMCPKCGQELPEGSS